MCWEDFYIFHEIFNLSLHEEYSIYEIEREKCINLYMILGSKKPVQRRKIVVS